MINKQVNEYIYIYTHNIIYLYYIIQYQFQNLSLKRLQPRMRLSGQSSGTMDLVSGGGRMRSPVLVGHNLATICPQRCGFRANSACSTRE